MWIRSQNRMQLQDVNRFVIEQFETGIYIVGNGCTLGIYSTKEKALKVLDEIQDAIEDTDYYRIDNIGHGTYALGKGVQVYQMPQDDEVEV
nr:MAG TPA: hypothetical protein [Caudoviricetes sp.]